MDSMHPPGGYWLAWASSYSVMGTPPGHGLVVCNHLSYLDILILSAAMPCFFVAKLEIGGWPILRQGGA
jgi:hypothetical protein